MLKDFLVTTRMMLADLVSKPLAIFLNKTKDEGCIPPDWKMAYVSPIFKKGPISLTSTVCKLMESFVKDPIMTPMKPENLLSWKQYDFINGRSTTIKLLSYVDKCIDTIVSGGVVDTIYFDFAKAFHSVSHKRLLGKFKLYGINGKVLNGLKLFQVIAVK